MEIILVLVGLAILGGIISIIGDNQWLSLLLKILVGAILVLGVVALARVGFNIWSS